MLSIRALYVPQCEGCLGCLSPAAGSGSIGHWLRYNPAGALHDNQTTKNTGGAPCTRS